MSPSNTTTTTTTTTTSSSPSTSPPSGGPSLSLPHHNHLQISSKHIVPFHVSSPSLELTELHSQNDLMNLLKRRLVAWYRKWVKEQEEENRAWIQDDTSSATTTTTKKKKKKSKKSSSNSSSKYAIPPFLGQPLTFVKFFSELPKERPFFSLNDSRYEYKVFIKQRIGDSHSPAYVKMRRVATRLPAEDDSATSTPEQNLSPAELTSSFRVLDQEIYVSVQKRQNILEMSASKSRLQRKAKKKKKIIKPRKEDIMEISSDED